MKTVRLAILVAAFLATLFVNPDGANAARRVLIVGDETVVDSALNPDGFTNLLRQFMTEEEEDVEFVPLGVNHATFADWRALLDKSRDQNVPTDVEGVSIKDELDKGADDVVIFLGLNDARKPSFHGFDLDPKTDIRKQPAEVGEKLRDDIVGFVNDLKARAPNCRVVMADLRLGLSEVPKQVRYVVDQTFEAQKSVGWDFIQFEPFWGLVNYQGRFCDEEIQLLDDEYRFTPSGAQIVAWSILLALDPDQLFVQSFRKADGNYWFTQSADSLPSSAFNEWEKLAKRFFEKKVDPRLRDLAAPGFALNATWNADLWTGTDNPTKNRDLDVAGPETPIHATVFCLTREIKADQPLDRGPNAAPLTFGLTDKTPKIDVVSSGNLKFVKNDPDIAGLHRNGRTTQGTYGLIFDGTLADLPCDVTIAIGSVQKTVRLDRRSLFSVSGVFPLEQEFSSLEDFPQEKAVSSVDYAALAGQDPSELRFAPKPGFSHNSNDSAHLGGNVTRFGAGDAPKTNPAESWTRESPSAPLASSYFGAKSPADPNWLNLAKSRVPEPFSGVYVLRYFDSSQEQSGTLKLGVKGYKTHVVERVYLNGEQVYFGELNVDDPEKTEVAVPVKLKKGANLMVARVDRTEWDWIVGFTLLDEEGRELQDSLGRW